MEIGSGAIGVAGGEERHPAARQLPLRAVGGAAHPRLAHPPHIRPLQLRGVGRADGADSQVPRPLPPRPPPGLGTLLVTRHNLVGLG